MIPESGKEPYPTLVNVSSDVSDADKKARAVDGLRLATRRFDPDCGLVVAPNQGETMPDTEGMIEFLPYRRLDSWDCEVAQLVEPEDWLHPM